MIRADEGHAQRNGTFVKDHNTPKNIQAAIDETLILPESLPERVIPESMNTVNNDNVDITFYENLKRSKEATKPLDEREGKSRFSAYEKMLDGLKNIKDGLEN